MPVSSWTDFQAICVTRKNLNLQYTETAEYYNIYAQDGLFLWQTGITKTDPTNADQEDFEDNHKALCNYASGTVHSPFPVDSYVCAYDGVGPTTVTTDTQDIFYKVEEDNLFLPGGSSYGINIGFGDWFQMDIVDHDNLLGYGVDFVLKSWVKKKFLGEKGCSCTTPYVGNPPAGFYIRVRYHKVGSLGQTNPQIVINFDFHRKVL